MKILIGSSGPVDGGQGISSYSKDLVLALNALDVDVYYVCPYSESKKFFADNNVKYLELGQEDNPRSAVSKILSFIDESGIDAVINNDHPYVQSAAPFLSIPFFSVVHMWRTAIFSLACYNHEYVDHIVTISNDMRTKVLEKYSVSGGKVPIIYNGVNVNEINDNAFDDIRGRTPRVIFVGGENTKKGFDKIVDSILCYPDKWKKIELYWFGSVSDRLKNILGDFNNISFKGKVPREELLSYYRPGDIFLLPSREEGCPMALLEAMAKGLIAMASDSRGSMDVIINSGMDGYISRFSRYSDECIGLIEMVCERADLRKRMAIKAHQKVKSQYTSKANAECYLDLIKGASSYKKRTLSSYEILKWHRPVVVTTGKASLINRVFIRYGILRRAGVFSV